MCHDLKIINQEATLKTIWWNPLEQYNVLEPVPLVTRRIAGPTSDRICNKLKENILRIKVKVQKYFPGKSYFHIKFSPLETGSRYGSTGRLHIGVGPFLAASERQN